MAKRFRNWTVLNLVKLAVLIDALNRESGALDERRRRGRPPDELIDDIRKLRGRTDLLEMPEWPKAEARLEVEASLATRALPWPPRRRRPSTTPAASDRWR